MKVANLSLLCAVLVATIHLDWMSMRGALATIMINVIPRGIAMVAVPFFFIFSGYFLAAHFSEKGWWLREIGKRIKSLVVPYYLWIFIALLVATSLSFVADFIAHRAIGSSSYLCREGVFKIAGLDFSCGPIIGALWYMRCLFLFVVASPIFCWLTRRLGGLWLAVSLISMFLLPQSDYLKYGWSVTGTFYFSLGIYIRMYKITVLKERLVCILSLLLAFTLLLIKVMAALFGVSLGGGGDHIMILSLLYPLWRLMPGCPLPAILQGCSFPVFVMHQIFFMVIGTVVQNLFPQSCRWVVLLCQFCGGILGILFFHAVLERVSPRISKILFCGRGESRWKLPTF